MSILTKDVKKGLSSPLNESPTGDSRQRGPKASVSPWALLTVTCILLGVSGGVRFWRDLKFSTLAKESAASPFALKDLPRSIGSWQAVEGSDGKLAPEIARIAGSSDHIIRSYRNEKTGELVTAFVLYGTATSVFGHTPEVCYPSAGYQKSADSVDHRFEIPGSRTVQYRSAFFSKSRGGIGIYDEADVHYTFLHNGDWLPDLMSRWKSFRYHPAIFKIQLEHRSSRVGMRDSSTESLMKELVLEIESRLSQQSKTRVATSATPRQ